MPDSKAKRGKQDRARVALGQEHERRYLLKKLGQASLYLYFAQTELDQTIARLHAGGYEQRKAKRLRAPGFPAAQKKARHGAK